MFRRRASRFDEFDEDVVDSEDDDNSWKVRRSALKARPFKSRVHNSRFCENVTGLSSPKVT